MVLGDAVSKLETFVWILNQIVKVQNFVSIRPKSIKLGQMTILSMIFHVMMSVYRLLKIETRPSSLLNFGTAY